MTLNRREFLRASCATILAATLRRTRRGQIAIRQTRSRHRPVRGGRSERSGGAPDRAGSVRQAWQAILCREYRRRRRQCRHWTGGQGGAGRLYRSSRSLRAMPPIRRCSTRCPTIRIKSFEAVTLAATAPTVLTVHPSIPAKTVKELIDVDQSEPRQVQLRVAGNGNAAPSARRTVSAVLSTRSSSMSRSTAAERPSDRRWRATRRSRSARCLRPCSTSRRASCAHWRLPVRHGRMSWPGGLPTIAQAGYPDHRGRHLDRVLVPAGTPKEIIDCCFKREIARLMQQPEVRDRMASMGYRPVGNTPAECAAHIAAETAKWAKVIREASIKVR